MVAHNTQNILDAREIRDLTVPHPRYSLFTTQAMDMTPQAPPNASAAPINFVRSLRHEAVKALSHCGPRVGTVQTQA